MFMFAVSMSPVAAAGERVLRATFAWPVYIDPAIGSDEASAVALVNLYDTLVVPTASGIEPRLATGWTVSDGDRVYTFELHRGVKFHDGTELTSKDVKYSFERLQTIGQGFAYLFQGRVQEVRTPDDYTVQFVLNEPFGPFISTLARLYIVNSDLVKANTVAGPYGENGDYGTGFLNTNDAGSGAYTVSSFDVATELVMRRFPDYFGPIRDDSPDVFHMIGTTETVTVRTWMRNGELEISDQWQTSEALASLSALPGVEIASYADGGQLYLMMNTKKPPTDDIHVRRAISYLLDYDALVEFIFPGNARANGPISSVLAGWNPDLPYPEMDLEKAMAELAQSKYAGQLSQYPIEYAWTAEVPDLEKVALMLQANASLVGLRVEIIKTPWLSLIEQAGSVETTAHINTTFVTPDYGEAGSMLDAKFHSSNAGSWHQIEWLMDPEIDALIDDALATVDYDERMAKYRYVQERVVELLPSVSLYDNSPRHAYRADIVDWSVLMDNPISALGHMHDMRLIGVKATD